MNVLVTAQLTDAVLTKVEELSGGDPSRVWVVTAPYNISDKNDRDPAVTQKRRRLLDGGAHCMNVPTFGYVNEALYHKVLAEQQRDDDDCYVPIAYGPSDIAMQKMVKVHLLFFYLDTIRTAENGAIIDGMKGWLRMLWSLYVMLMSEPSADSEADWDRRLLSCQTLRLPENFKDCLHYDVFPGLMGATPEIVEIMKTAKHTDALGREYSVQHDILRWWVKVLQPYGPDAPVADVAAVFMWQNGISPSGDNKTDARRILDADTLAADTAVNWGAMIMDCERDDTNAMHLVCSRQGFSWSEDRFRFKRVVLQLPAGDQHAALRTKIVKRIKRAQWLKVTELVDPDSRNGDVLEKQWA